MLNLLPNTCLTKNRKYFKMKIYIFLIFNFIHSLKNISSGFFIYVLGDYSLRIGFLFFEIYFQVMNFLGISWLTANLRAPFFHQEISNTGFMFKNFCYVFKQSYTNKNSYNITIMRLLTAR